MADNSLKERLLGHAKSFDGLLSLIPAKFYYAEDHSDQWKKKKQTKEQAAAARRAKLDPDSAKTAKDVMDERARKRKLEETKDDDDDDVIKGIEKELPKQGLKLPHLNKVKKQKIVNLTDKNQPPKTVSAAEKAEKRRIKKEKRKEREKKRPILTQKNEEESILGSKNVTEASEATGVEIPPTLQNIASETQGLIENPAVDENSTSVSSKFSSPTFENPTDPSTNTSTSSVISPAKAPKHIKLPTDPELLHSRLVARIEALRAARKADGPNGRPARNRQELLEARRKKEEQRRAHKKEIRLKAKAEEDARREASIASARNSPGTGYANRATVSLDQNLSFGRILFSDGQHLSNDLSRLKEAPKKRGPQDAATALLASENKKSRMAGLDEEKRADIEEKELWLNASKKAHGEKVRDDVSLLKKTLKRKEKLKKKSEREWTERKEGVAKSQAMKQKKREENLKKRRDEKGGKGKGKGKAAKSKKSKVRSRPGFEGSLGLGKGK